MKRVDFNAAKPGTAVVEIKAEVVQFLVGSKTDGPGLGFALLGSNTAVQAWFVADDPEEQELHMATLAVQLVAWLQEHRPDSEVHDYLEAELGIRKW